MKKTLKKLINRFYYHYELKLNKKIIIYKFTNDNLKGYHFLT